MTGPAAPEITRHVLGPFETNCYVVAYPGSADCWVIDAGFEPAALIGTVRDKGLTPAAIILTHAHADHIAGLDLVRRAWPAAPVLVHEAEEAWLADPELNLSLFTGVPVSAGPATGLIGEGDRPELAGRSWAVIHTPGHSPGGITLWDEASSTAFVGDSLFAGSIGRTDFPGSDHRTLEASIRDKLYRLPDETRVYPGHGPPTTIGKERRTNPFVRG